MKKLVFGITSLQLGGAERVLVDIVNKLSDRYDITIFTLYGNGEFINELNPNVSLISMHNDKYQNLSKFKKLIMSIKMIIPYYRKKIYEEYIDDKYDVVISFLEGPITWIFSNSKANTKIAWVHNDILSAFGSGLKAKSKRKLNQKCYKNYDKIVFVSKDNLEKFINTFKDNTVEKHVIYNYLNTELVLKKSNEFKPVEIKNDVVSFLQVSRIVEQKALFRLLEVHEKLIQNKLNHRIYIIGEGPQMSELQSKINSKKLNDTFVLLGKKSNPYPYIKESNYFMLASFYEGFPMVLLEGKALNKYILITDSAARETLIGYENNSIIVDNSKDGIYDGMKYLIEQRPVPNPDCKFDSGNIINQIVDLIEGE